MSSPRCEEVRELLPELALGILGGEERARVLDHVAVCARCETLVADLSRVADDVLLIGPRHEPSIGFEERVIERLRRDRPPPRARRFIAVLAAAVLAAGLAGGSMYLVTRNDRALARRSLQALQDGKEFRTARLLTAEGNIVGHVYAYEGLPSWVYVIAGAPASDGRYRVLGIESSGRSVDFGQMAVRSGQADWAQTTTANLSQVSLIRLVSKDGRAVLEARFPRD